MFIVNQIVWKKAAAVCFLISAIACSAAADDVTDSIEEAVDAYKKGEYKKASEELTYALESINQKKGNSLKIYLPEPLEGWTADEATAQTANAAMLGGGTMLSRTYHKSESLITIEMVMDSPLMQGIAMMMANPMFRSSEIGELTRINKEKAMIKYDNKEKSGDITMIVANRIMVTVKGETVSKEELIAYAKAIDLKKLKAME
ncbi:MAG: hypothetical protein LT067_05140 [Sulfurovum sp.]|nr:hypothetical protein [Sulfurovum sp.]